MKYYCTVMALLLGACGVDADIGSPVECGEGTVIRNNICVAQVNPSNTQGEASDLAPEKTDAAAEQSPAGSKLLSTNATRAFSWNYEKANSSHNINWAISSGTGLSQCAAASSYPSGLSDGDEQLYIRVQTASALPTSCPEGSWNISDQNCFGTTGDAHPNCAYLRRWNEEGEFYYCSGDAETCYFARAQGGVVVVSNEVDGCRVQIEVNVGDQSYNYDFISRQDPVGCFEF